MKVCVKQRRYAACTQLFHLLNYVGYTVHHCVTKFMRGKVFKLGTLKLAWYVNINNCECTYVHIQWMYELAH